MKKVNIYMLASLFLMLPLLTGFGSSIGNIEFDNLNSNNGNMFEISEEDVVATIYQSPGFIGYNLDIENKGLITLENVKYQMRTKAAITGTGIFLNELLQNGTIETIQPDETITIQFRPLKSDTRSPLGLGNLYMDALIEFDNTTIRTQQRSILILFLLIGYRDTYMDISPEVAYEKLLAEDFDLVIDVVGLEIYNNGHLPGAVNYIWANGNLSKMIPTLDVNGTYLVYCHTDPPSTAGAQSLIDAGIMKTYRLEGNYGAWVAAGYPVET